MIKNINIYSNETIKKKLEIKIDMEYKKWLKILIYIVMKL